MSIATTIISMIMVAKAFHTIKSDDRQLKVSQTVPGISLEHPPAQTVQVVAENGDDESAVVVVAAVVVVKALFYLFRRRFGLIPSF